MAYMSYQLGMDKHLDKIAFLLEELYVMVWNPDMIPNWPLIA